MAELNAARLAELQASDLPRLDWRELIEVKGGALSDEDSKTLDEYFRQFVKHDGCVNCGAQQGGELMDAFLGRAKFTWGIVHGEGYCSACGYPARAYHRDIGPIKFVQAILQYHPADLTAREKQPA